MTATDTIRAMLDERGVEWADEENKIDRVTTWNVNDGHAVFYESKTACPAFLKFIYYDPTPEQAIEATLGGVPYSKPTVLSDLQAENAELRELVRRMFYAVHPADREKFLTNVAELGVEV